MILITKNKKAYHDYEILETQEAGLELFGYEVKAMRSKQVNLKGSYCWVINNELWVKAMHIGVWYSLSLWNNVESMRPRKVFLNKKKIIYYGSKVKEGWYSIVPLELYFSGSLIKMRVALVKGKKQHQKKQTLKERTLDREAKMMLKKSY